MNRISLCFFIFACPLVLSVEKHALESGRVVDIHKAVAVEVCPFYIGFGQVEQTGKVLLDQGGVQNTDESVAVHITSAAV